MSPFTAARLAVAVFAVILVTGCTRKIGDKCSISTDCSVSGDRLCDTTQPGGYCTVFNCQPNRCPEEAACVAFSDDSCGGGFSGQDTRLRRTFCMFTCGSDDDCRAGYACRDLGAQVVDIDAPSRQVCVVAASGVSMPPATPAPICSPFNDASVVPSSGDAAAVAADAAVETAVSEAGSGEAAVSEAGSNGDGSTAAEASETSTDTDGAVQPDSGADTGAVEASSAGGD